MQTNTLEKDVRKMYDYEILEEEPISTAEAMEHIKKIPKKDMTFEQKQAYDHINKMSKLNSKKAKEMKEELNKLEIRKLKEIQIIRIIDLLPKTADELRFIVADTQTSFDSEESEKIMQVVKKYAKE